MSISVGITCMKLALNPSGQVDSKTGKSNKTCPVSKAWNEMNDKRYGRDEDIDHSRTNENIWLAGSSADDVEAMIKKEVDRMNDLRKSTGARAIRGDAVQAIEIIDKASAAGLAELSEEQRDQFFKDSDRVMNDLLHEWNPNWKVMATVIHKDEGNEHLHRLVFIPTEDKNGLPSFNAKREVGIKFYNHIHEPYGERMRELGWNVDDIRVYEELSEEEREQRKSERKNHGLDSDKYKSMAERDRQELIKENIALKAQNETLLNENKQLRTAALEQNDRMTLKHQHELEQDKQIAAKQAELNSINEAINAGDNTLQKQHEIINENRLTIAKQSNHLQEVKDQVKNAEKQKNELENVEAMLHDVQNQLKKAHNQKKLIEDDLQTTSSIKLPRELKKPFQRDDEVTFKREDIKIMLDHVQKRSNNAAIVMKTSKRMEQDNNERSEQLDQRERDIQRMERSAKWNKQAADDAYNKQKNLNDLYDQSERNNRQLSRENSSLKSENNDLKRENSMLKQLIKPLQDEVEQWKEQIINACKHIADVTKAINYIAEKVDLPDPINNLVKGISKYTEDFLHNHKQYEMRADVENNHDVSNGILEAAQELKRERHKGFER